MRKYLLRRFHLDLAPSQLTDTTRDELLASIAGAAPTSALIQGSPAMQASVAALATKGTKYKGDRDKVSDLQIKLAAAYDTSNESRAAVDLELMGLGSLVATNAKTAADVTGSGFKEKGPPAPPPQLLPPSSVDIKFPKRQKGQFTCAPHVPKGDRSQWIVEMSLDPFGPTTWVVVHGTGKTRVITGASGSRVWVRYAMVRGTQQSAWGDPVMVVIP